MTNTKLIALALAAICLLVAPLPAWSQGASPPPSTEESGKTSGKGMIAAEHTGEGSGNVEEQIRVLSERIGQAYVKGDYTLLEKYLADDYTAIRANGTLYSKAQEIENFKSGALKLESDNVQERKIRAYGNAVVVDGLASVKGTSNGKAFSGDFRFTRVWVNQEGDWKSVAYQATRVAPASPAASETQQASVWFSRGCTERSSAQVARTEVYPIQTMSLTDQQFLTGAKDGKPTTIAGVLRIPRPGTDRLPAVILVHGSAGIGGYVDYWQQQLNDIGVATFTIDDFAGRGIENTTADQAKLGRLSAIIDLYRALAILAAHTRIDPNRIAVMGFSRGAQVALYASLTRFQKMYAPEGLSFAAYLTFYAPCNTRYLDDEAVSNKPIRLFHGTADDYIPVVPCRAYVERLRKAGKDVQLTEYPDAQHVFDNPLYKETPVKFPTWQTTRRCTLKEESPGRIINAETKQPFTYTDPCVDYGPHIAYNPAALNAATQAVKDFLQATFSPK